MTRKYRTIVAFFSLLLVATRVHCLDPEDFSQKLYQIAEDILRVDEFQVLVNEIGSNFRC